MNIALPPLIMREGECVLFHADGDILFVEISSPAGERTAWAQTRMTSNLVIDAPLVAAECIRADLDAAIETLKRQPDPVQQEHGLQP